MASHASLQVIQPIPYFPGLRNVPHWAKEKTRHVGQISISHENMFYTPKLFKSVDGYWLYRAIVKGLAAAHAKSRIDLIDAHFGYPDGVGCFLAARRLGIPFFMTFRGLEADYLQDKRIRPQVRAALEHAAGCICVSHFMRDIAIDYGAAPEKLRVIHNAVDRSLFAPGDRSEARARLGLPIEGRLVVSVGHLLAVKGHHTLIRAFRDVRDAIPGARLAIIGGPAHEPEYPNELRSLVDHLGLIDAVAFIGKIPPVDVVTWLQAGDSFALATQREGCCNAILEALATGIPVVTTPVGDNVHFVREGHNGFIVPVDDPKKVADGLMRALRRATWDAKTISRTLPVGDWAQVGRQVMDFFEERLQGSALEANESFRHLETGDRRKSQ